MNLDYRSVQLPDDHWLSVPQDPRQHESLCDWLGRHGVELNTRCNKRGLCQGCEVRVGEAPPAKSCQIKASATPPELPISIPRRSLRDRSLSGVNTFEISWQGGLHQPRPGVGLSIDIGTTTVAAALWDLSSGRSLAQGGASNAQACYGDNVLSRIQFAVEKDGLNALREVLLRESLEPLIYRLLKEASLPVEAITEATAAGNPTMLHSLALEDMTGLSRYPFRPAFLDELSLSPERHALPLECNLVLLPGLGAFVGADITAGALATGMTEAAPPVLLMDFGTNGELLLKTANGFLATATAMGPAFEGGRLSHGATAAPGVVSSLTYNDGAWRQSIIGGDEQPPRGLSGAAYLDFMAIGLRSHWIHESGRFDNSAPQLIRATTDDGLVERRVPVGGDLFVSEADVAELLQAKAAIAAGVQTLLEEAGLIADELNTVYVAGSFGYYLNPASAQEVGLLPQVPRERIQIVGNTSLGGASLALLNPHLRNLLRHLKASTLCIELNQIPTFADNYLDNLQLNHPQN